MSPTKFTLTNEQIAAACGSRVSDVAANWPLLEKELDKRGLSDAAVKIAAIATVVTEVGAGFHPINEFGGNDYFTKNYENRHDLGNTHAGDGARYHGRGYIQVTGRSNYRSYGGLLGVPLEDNPELALDSKTAAAVLAEYFKQRGTGNLAIKGDWRQARISVNGGTNGLTRFLEVKDKLLAAAGNPVAPGNLPIVETGSRILRVTKPLTRGTDVQDVQRKLGADHDGVYGKLTGAAVLAWKKRIGYPDDEANDAIGPRGINWLLGKEPLPPDYVQRAKQRAKK